MPSETIFFILMALFVILVIRVCAGTLDVERVQQYVESRGWKLVEQKWDPFGPGWAGSEHERIYQIAYEDEEGRQHRAHVKTSMWAGVYLSDDRIISEAKKTQDLQVENERLRARVEELENKS